MSEERQNAPNNAKFEVRLPEDELARWREGARRYNMTTSGLVRQVMGQFLRELPPLTVLPAGKATAPIQIHLN